MTDKGDMESTETTRSYFFDISEDEKCKQKIKKPVLTSTKNGKTSSSIKTNEDIIAKLESAEERRKKKYELRAKRTAENREKILNLAVKLDKLKLHHQALKEKSSRNESILSKREYVKLAGEVSMQFEEISTRTAQDLKRAEGLQDILIKTQK